MINHPLAYTQNLSDDQIQQILSVSYNILANTGIEVQSDEIVNELKKAGINFDTSIGRVKFSKHIIDENLKLVPPEFTLHARNEQHSIHIGGKTMMIAPGYGSAFIADRTGKRREATLNDFQKFAYLAQVSNMIDVNGGILVEPNDVPAQLRPLQITSALVKYSDKPFMGSVDGKTGAKETLEIAKIIFGDLKKPCVLSLININSPLHLSSRMADAMLEYVRHNQPILLTPGIMMGISAPVTVAGALAQAFAEILASVTIIQILNPTNPVIIGIGGFGSDLQTGGPGFGRPENAIGTQLGAQIARTLKIPFRCSAAVTGSRLPDCRSGYERMMTALTAFNTGAHFCLQAAGILDCINAMSYEQFMIDMEIWSYIEKLARPIDINEETLAQKVIETNKTGLLENDHTVKFMRNELYFPQLAKPENYDQWFQSKNSDIISIAAQKAENIFSDIQPPALDKAVENELNKYISQRVKELY
ncbi:MAG: trimethylamine methyltransferase family protein [Phycisphaerales bacterium]